jgi:hypothetical protein
MNDSARVELHADSVRERPLDEPRPQMIVARSYLPGFVVITIEASPPRTIVVEAARLIDALQSV